MKYVHTKRYKAIGANAVDEQGNLDLAEFINIARDDALSYPKVVHRTYPPPTEARMENTIKPFVARSVYVNDILLDALGKKLGLPANSLSGRHRIDEASGSETRCIKNPPRPSEMSESRSVIGAHTDFGSLVSTPLHMHPGLPYQHLLSVIFAQSSGWTPSKETWN